LVISTQLFNKPKKRYPIILAFTPDSSSPRSPRSSDGNRDELTALLPSPSSYPKAASAIRRLRLENERLQAEVTRLRRLVVSGASSVLAEKRTPTENSGDPNSKANVLEMELQLAKEALISKIARASFLHRLHTLLQPSNQIGAD
jgi:hypothetical protein